MPLLRNEYSTAEYICRVNFTEKNFSRGIERIFNSVNIGKALKDDPFIPNDT